ncbi:MAG: hypothetical protein A2075_07450 [Geobacteraceae bacterium GWC2_58_44]|nr:MAG: hypothetical protein A2075_07450 [Geobacteraceae bacterium GWC2_58_44]HBG07444.1 hypothetical protein [Geobacter sp.]
MRGNEFGKVDVGQMPERMRTLEVQDDWIIGQPKVRYGEGSVTEAVNAAVANIWVLLVLKRTARALT